AIQSRRTRSDKPGPSLNLPEAAEPILVQSGRAFQFFNKTPQEAREKCNTNQSTTVGTAAGEVGRIANPSYRGCLRGAETIFPNHANSFLTTFPSRKSWIGRPVEVVSSLWGSMPRQLKRVADTSSGVQASLAGAMPWPSVLPWT